MTFDEMLRRNGGKVAEGRISVKDLKPKQYRWILAIDPDIHKSGVVLLDTQTKRLWVHSYSAWQVFETFMNIAYGKLDLTAENLLVLVEAGWKNEKSCWHPAQGKSAEKIAKDVGRNQQTGIMFLEIAAGMGLNTEDPEPLNKKMFHWHGQDGKVADEDLRKFITDFDKLPKMNQDQRDALLLAWTRAGFKTDCDNELLKKLIKMS